MKRLPWLLGSSIYARNQLQSLGMFFALTSGLALLHLSFLPLFSAFILITSTLLILRSLGKSNLKALRHLLEYASISLLVVLLISWNAGPPVSATAVTEFTPITTGSAPVKVAVLQRCSSAVSGFLTAGGPARLPGIYFVESAGTANRIGRLSLSGSDGCSPASPPIFTEWIVPTASSVLSSPSGSPVSTPGIAVNPTTIATKLAIAFAESSGDKIGLLRRSGVTSDFDSFTEYSLPSGSGPRGVTWLNEDTVAFVLETSNKIGLLCVTINTFNCPAANTFSFISVPTGSAGLRNIVATEGNILWFTESTANKLGKLIVSASNIFEYSLDTLPGAPHGPLDLAVDRDGFVWITGRTTGNIFRFNPATEAFTRFFNPTIAGSAEIHGIAIDSQGQIWFTEQANSRVARLNPIDRVFTEFSLISAGSGPTGIAFETAGNALWVAQFNAGTLARIVAPGPVLIVSGGATVTTTTAPGPAITTIVPTIVGALVTTVAIARASAGIASAVSTATSVGAAATTSTTTVTTSSLTTNADTISQVVTSIIQTSVVDVTTSFITTFATTTIVNSTSFTTTAITTTNTQVIQTFTTIQIPTTVVTTRQLTVIPGFPSESIAVGILAGMLAILVLKRRRRQAGKS